jgi:hypothetical protein
MDKRPKAGDLQDRKKKDLFYTLNFKTKFFLHFFVDQ